LLCLHRRPLAAGQWQWQAAVLRSLHQSAGPLNLYSHPRAYKLVLPSSCLFLFQLAHDPKPPSTSSIPACSASQTWHRSILCVLCFTRIHPFSCVFPRLLHQTQFFCLSQCSFFSQLWSTCFSQFQSSSY
jgi:hypothetical protein